MFSLDLGHPFDPAHCMTSFLVTSVLISAKGAPIGPECSTPCSHKLASILIPEYLCRFSVGCGRNTEIPQNIRFLAVWKLMANPGLPTWRPSETNDPAIGKRR